MQSIRRMFVELMNNEIKNPAIIIICDSNWQTMMKALSIMQLKPEHYCLMVLEMVFALGHHFGNNKLLPKIKLKIYQFHCLWNFTGNPYKNFKNRIYQLPQLRQNII